jgi:hypothetical protein
VPYAATPAEVTPANSSGNKYTVDCHAIPAVRAGCSYHFWRQSFDERNNNHRSYEMVLALAVFETHAVGCVVAGVVTRCGCRSGTV